MRDEFEKNIRRSESRRIPKHPTKAPRLREQPSVEDIDTLVIKPERGERISKAQYEEEKWGLRGEFDKLTHGQVYYAGEIVDLFVRIEDGTLPPRTAS